MALQSAQRTDLASGDSGVSDRRCAPSRRSPRSWWSYSYLMTIEGELTDFGDDHTLRGVVRRQGERAQVSSTASAGAWASCGAMRPLSAVGR